MGSANRDGSVSVADLIATGAFTVDSNERLASSGSMPAALTNSSPNQTTTLNASGRACVGADFANARYWFWNGTSIWQAEGALPATVFTDKTKPAALAASNNTGVHMLFWPKDGNIYLAGNDGTTASIWRAAPVANPGTLTWSAALKSYTTGALSLGPGLYGGSQFLFAGEYGDPSGGPTLWRSADGTTWTSVLNLPTARHIHAVAEDPNVPGSIWLTVGDAGAPNWVYHSTDHGATWNIVLSQQGWQGVQISFDARYVYIASDQFSRALTVYALNKVTLVPQWMANDYHYDWAVPGGAAARTITDLAATSGSKTITSAAQAQFTSADIGRAFRNVYTGGTSPVFPDRTWITAVTNATTATINQNALATGTFTGTIEGDRFFGNCFYGAVDPSTGIYYCITNDSSSAGTVPGMFAVDNMLPAAGRLRLVTTLHKQPLYQVFIGNNWCLFDAYQVPLPA